MIKQKIDNYIIPITLMFVMGMMLFRVNDPLCLKTIFLLMLTFAVKPFVKLRSSYSVIFYVFLFL